MMRNMVRQDLLFKDGKNFYEKCKHINYVL